jgi:hypothetical protein
LLSEVRAYVAREIGEVKATAADASRVGELMMHVAWLEARIAELERELAAKTKTVKLAA